MAFSASGLVRTNHCFETSGSTTALAALAFAGVDGVVFDAFEEAERIEIGDDALAGFVAIEADVGAAVRGDFCVASDDFYERELVALAGFEIVRIVRGSDFNDAGAEFGVGHFVENDGDFAVHQRKAHGFAVEIEIALVARIDGDGCVAEHGFGARGGDGEEAVSSRDRIVDVPEAAGHFLVNAFEIRDGGVAAGAPVDHVLAAIDETAFVEA